MLYQNYIVEIKRYHNGEFEHNVNWAWDENEKVARLKAEAKYHEILSSAAISNTAEHSAILFTSQGFPLMFQNYTHEQEETNE